MQYYSVRFSEGVDAGAAGREAKETFRGIDADYTGHGNFFYVQTPWTKTQLEGYLSGYRTAGYTVEVKKISKTAYNWRKR